jgi:hypothetical protein
VSVRRGRYEDRRRIATLKTTTIALISIRSAQDQADTHFVAMDRRITETETRLDDVATKLDAIMEKLWDRRPSSISDDITSLYALPPPPGGLEPFSCPLAVIA